MANQTITSSVTLKDGCCVEAQSRGFKITIDEPQQMGGTDLGMTPVELLLSALGSCLTITISMFSKSFHIDIKELKVDVEGVLDPMAAMGNDKDTRTGYSSIKVNVHIASDAPQNKIERLIKMAEEKCPVSDTIRKGTPVASDIEINTIMA